MKAIMKGFYFDCLQTNIIFCLIYLLSFKPQLSWAFDGLSKSYLESKEGGSRYYHLWKSAGILDGIFPLSSEATNQADFEEGGKTSSGFSFFKHEMITPTNNNAHGSFEDFHTKETFQHSKSLLKQVEPYSASYTSSIDCMGYIQPSVVSYQKYTTTQPSFKEIQKSEPSERYHPTEDSQCQPEGLEVAFRRPNEVNGHVMEMDNLKADTQSTRVFPKTKEIPKAQIGSSNDPYSKSDLIERKLRTIDTHKLNQQPPHNPLIASKDPSKQDNIRPDVQVGDPEVFSKVAKVPSSWIKSKTDVIRKVETQNINSYNHKGSKTKPKGLQSNEPKRLVTQEKTNQFETQKISPREALPDVKEKKPMPEVSKTPIKVISDKNSFVALNDFDEALNPENRDAALKEQKKEFQTPSFKTPHDEEATAFRNTKADNPVVDLGNSFSDQNFLEDEKENLNNINGDSSTEKNSPGALQDGNTSGSEVDLGKERLKDSKDTAKEIEKDGQGKRKTLRSKKGKKNNKSKKGKNNSAVNFLKPSISLFDTVVPASINNQVPKIDKKTLLTKEELFKLDRRLFLQNCLKFHDKTIGLSILINDLEFDYLNSHRYMEGMDTWKEDMWSFVHSFGDLSEGARRVIFLDEQFREKLIVWKWHHIKNHLPEYAQDWAKSLKADEEFPTFEESSPKDYQIYRQQAKFLENQSPVTMQKAVRIFGGQVFKRVVTLDLMSQYQSNFVKEVCKSGEVKEGLVDLAILIAIDQSLDLGTTDYLTKIDRTDIQSRASKLLDAMNGKVISYSGEEYKNRNFVWRSEPTRYYLTEKNPGISERFEAHIKDLARHADLLGVEIPKRVESYIPISTNGLGLGEVLLCAHSGMKFGILLEIREIFKLLKQPPPKRSQVIGKWSSISGPLTSEAILIKRYCDLRNCIISGLNQFIDNF
ncbi:uncharacterized protein MELLADRAFT_66458 [Melampsora larici-populina 98AG31]|uniref:Uncharacterized protein n=1 Tax=Melampsora larici-populina (strain 98AG31 / pathotype 3-4-7) TaxID=747676 RepID=F4RZA3_MELLP|nr:uncharacterized protein MELLADRAFT_66458 [Melampsora larici-populina 98AG31]EGG02288.1 hypothetical protein MELLADRAFT_66458 [Melampsora larici-populina 98AG31]